MTRSVPVGSRGLILVGVAVALAVLVLPLGGARPAGAQPPPVPYHECFFLPAPPPDVVVNLETQFPNEEVIVGPGVYICPPAVITIPGGPPPEGDLNLPHLRCFDIDGPPPGRTVDLTTLFGVEEGVTVGDARLLCAPALKQVIEPPGPLPEPLPPDAPHYKCYDIVGDPPAVLPVVLETQFGLLDVAVGPASLLCLPTIKTILPGGLPEGTLEHPHLKCYTIAAPPPVPDHIVQVETQFGLEGLEFVGPAQLLCVPALKVIVPNPGVGGVGEISPLAETTAEGAAVPADGSGWSAGSLAALATGVAAAVLMLGAGAWYAVRRRLS